jgi:aminomethyltransferase
MRTSVLRSAFAAAEASFAERCGAETVTAVSDVKTEYYRVRNGAGLTDFSHTQRFRVPEENGLDFLDALFAGNVAKVRFGRVLHTFLADDAGMLVADCYVANNDEEFFVVCESLVDDAALDAIFERNGAAQAGVERLTESQVTIGIDGYRAWAVAKELFGADVLGLPYLSIEVYPFEGEKVRLIRAGKTSEFGYLLTAPNRVAEALCDRLRQSAAKNEGGLCGSAVHNELRLEGRFFNIFAEGQRVKDPLALGLQWMIDFDKERFCGREAILARRSAGPGQKIVGISAPESALRFAVGDHLFDGTARVGEVVATCFSFTLDRAIALALLPSGIAYAGLAFNHRSATGPLVSTVSMPPIMPRSLTVKLDDM